MGKTLVLLTVVAALLLPAPPATALEVDDDLLALVAMPLAVAAVSEMTDVPTNDLIDMVTLLNDADVAPVQFIETVRYVPVALVVEHDTQPRFIEVVREQEQSGVRGPALVTFIEQRLYTYGMPASVDLDVVAPRLVEVDPDPVVFVPPVVRTRVAEVKAHPHGGPPGQLKKAAGVQTGAEIVHRNRNRSREREVVRVTRKSPPVTRVPRTVVIEPERKIVASNDDRGRGRAKHEAGDDHGRGKGKGHGNGNGKGKGKG